MKNWSATSAKFYSELMNGLASFFGLNAEETTEAELHQQLTEAGSLQQIKSAAMQEATAAVQAKMEDFSAQLAALQTRFDALETDAQAKGEKVAELEGELETVRGQLAEKETAVAGHVAQIKTLSGEVASLKAGKPIDKHTPADDSKPGVSGGNAGGSARKITMSELTAALAN